MDISHVGHYVDVHTHLTHEKFHGDLKQVIERAANEDFRALVVNGLEPISNRQILKLAEDYEIVQPALGIYPINAVNKLLSSDFVHEVAPFDVFSEIDFIEQQAKAGRLAAVGECGLDAYWLDQPTFALQEQVFQGLIDIALAYDLPIIIHTRKLEKRSIEIMRSREVKKVNFHCFGGKVKLAIQAAQDFGFFFSIPTNAHVNQAFKKMLAELPLSAILTETDAPFLAPKRGERNEPVNIKDTIKLLAELRSINIDQAKKVVWDNYQTLFGSR
jgi:TatD DNase family protein